MFTTAGIGGLCNASVLVSEASLLLNGAHRNCGGSWIKRCIVGSTTSIEIEQPPAVSPSSASPSRPVVSDNPPAVSSMVSPVFPVSPLPVVASVLSELGLSNFTKQHWRAALEATVSMVDSSLSSNRPPTCASILSHYRKYSSGWHPNHGKRHQLQSRFFSTMPHSRPRLWEHARLVRGSQWPAFKRGFSIYQLEDRANSESDNPQIQAKYLETVVESDPEYVIRRFESGRYAVDEDVRKVYQKALGMTDQSTSSDTQAFLGSLFGKKGQDSKMRFGTPENPVHMAITRGKGSVLKNELWSMIRLVVAIVITAFIFMSLLSSTVLNGVKNSTKQMQTKYRPDMGEKKYTFDDVQGVDEAKEEVQEVVEFLKNPEKFQRLGARLPTGVLLVGPPGTGKTLLAKAIAGEAEVPFFFVSGSEFDEMFVGVGASRVRKLFETARQHKPCVLFIDELDAVGGKRNSSPMHPYSRMTLNQLLVELDGYKELEGVIIIGATNFPEALDGALTRPGRFDNRIIIPMPDIRARHNILKLHAKKIILDEGVDLEVIARATTGFTGADLANLVNQAALRGCVEGKDMVTYEDLEYAKDNISMGRERLSAVVHPKDRLTVAFHEGGHAIMALFTPGAMPVYKATIVPRGPALGLVAQIPENDALLKSKKEMLAMIDVCMGGRVAEELLLGAENVTTGASSDFEQATKLATSMVTIYGMSDLIGPVKHNVNKCSSNIRRQIDDEVRMILKDSYERTRSLLKVHAEEHKRLADALLKYETLTAEEIKLVVANKPLNRTI